MRDLRNSQEMHVDGEEFGHRKAEFSRSVRSVASINFEVHGFKPTPSIQTLMYSQL